MQPDRGNGMDSNPPEVTAPITEAEIAEYREMRPQLQRIIEDWRRLRGQQGCPAMRHILAD